jgi:hypothetical protein
MRAQGHERAGLPVRGTSDGAPAGPVLRHPGGKGPARPARVRPGAPATGRQPSGRRPPRPREGRPRGRRGRARSARPGRARCGGGDRGRAPPPADLPGLHPDGRRAPPPLGSRSAALTRAAPGPRPRVRDGSAHGERLPRRAHPRGREGGGIGARARGARVHGWAARRLRGRRLPAGHSGRTPLARARAGARDPAGRSDAARRLCRGRRSGAFRRS